MEKNLSSGKISIKNFLGQKEGVTLEENLNITRGIIRDSNVDIISPIIGKIKLGNKENKILEPKFKAVMLSLK